MFGGKLWGCFNLLILFIASIIFLTTVRKIILLGWNKYLNKKMKKKSIKKKKEKMTIDKLAELTQRGFEALGGEMKSEINGLRGEMKSEISDLRGETKSEISDLRGEMKEKFYAVLNNQDQILKRLEDLETDNTMDVSAHRRHEDKLESHEIRIVAVENKVLA